MPNMILGTDTTVDTKLITAIIEPTTDSTYDIGTSSKKYNNIYANYFYGDGSNLRTDLIKSKENGDIEIATDTSGTENTRLIITNTGNIGIWNNSPSSLLDYAQIHPYHTSAIQELHNIVKNQQTRINDQQTTINELNSKVQSLEYEKLLIKSAVNELLSEAGKSTI